MSESKFFPVIFCLLLVPVLLTLSPVLEAAQLSDQKQFIVQAIHIEGLKAIKRETVLNYLPIKIGEHFNTAQSSDIISKLYATGFFEDVKLAHQEADLSIIVIERPHIISVSITGKQLFPKKQLTTLLREKSLVQGALLNRAALEELKAQLLIYYKSQGYYKAAVQTSIQYTTKHQVAITIHVNEGPRLRIADIKILGHQAFTEQKLKSILPVAPHGLFSMLTGSDQYTPAKQDAALEALHSFYLDKGYFHFEVASHQITLTPDGRSVHWLIHIVEGPQYTLESHQIKGMPVSDMPIQKFTKLGYPYNRQAVRDTEEAIKEKLGNQGYIFALVNTTASVNEAQKTLRLVTQIVPGRPVSVRRIDIQGNYRTQDEALRRLLLQEEGSVISLEKVKGSVMRLNTSKLVKEGQSKITPIINDNLDDQVDLQVAVEEASLNQIIANAGFSRDGLIGSFKINQPNVLGTGSAAVAALNISRYNKAFSVSYNNPFYTLDGIQKNFEIYYNSQTAKSPDKRSKVKEAVDSNFAIQLYGGKLGYSIPVTFWEAVQCSAGAQHMELLLPAEASRSLEMQQFVNQYGTHLEQGLLDIAWAQNSFNRLFFPTSGIRWNAKSQFRLSPKGPSYYKLQCDGSAYLPLAFVSSEDHQWIIHGSWKISYGAGITSKEQLPFFENYLVGGVSKAGIVRGYETSSLGPRDSLGRPCGGNMAISGSLAIILPKPFSESYFRSSLFIDTGNVYKLQSLFYTKGEFIEPLYVSAGVGVDCLVPGINIVLGLSFAKALNPSDQSMLKAFQVNMGMEF